jgi:hypothetical protein
VNDPKGARCLSGLCDHPECRSPGFGLPAETTVQGTACCSGCAPVLLEPVLHPFMIWPPALPHWRLTGDGIVVRYLALETGADGLVDNPYRDALTAARDRQETTLVTQCGVIVATIGPAEPAR